MAKFRKNHIVEKNQAGASFTRVGLFGAVLLLLFFLFDRFGSLFSGSDNNNDEQVVVVADEGDDIENGESTISDAMLPTSTTGMVIKHQFYALSYNETHEQAEWVTYELTRERLNNNEADRANNFRTDPKVTTGSADIYDYRGSGYDRGHMVPAGDMGFDKRAMSQTFYMSNMSPQVRNFNGGIWRELEENIRDWARRFKHLYIASGPILTDRLSEKIGDNGVSVPKRYYKVILDISEPELKGIGFIMPNEVTDAPLSNFAVSIDDVEAQTGIDFFHGLMGKRQEQQLESSYDMNAWRTSEKRYQLRLENWNKR